MTRWPEGGLPLAWKQPCGGGYASFSIANGRAFTIEQRRDREVVAAYDLKSGRELWVDSWPAFFQETMGGDGPRATPTWHEGNVYALGATGVFRCLDAATGRVVWGRNILEDAGAENLPWGMAASPLVVDEKVIVLPGGRRNNSVAAYDKRTGELIWTAQNDKQAYVSPALANLAEKRQLIVVSSTRVMGLAVENGSLLWEFPWVTQYDTNASQPIVLDDRRFVISSGYGHGAALIEIRGEGESFSARAVWENTLLKSRFNGFVLQEGYIYGLDEGILVCLEASTGSRKWKGGRYGYGQLILAAGHLVITTEDGDIVLVKATPEKHEEVSRFSALSGKTWNNPAMADGYLLVRNEREMAAYRIGAP
jgi:outer membrane protein assembly factor BamB